ncbi:DUF2281 domain-containing protein [Moraxella sp. FZLJ2107]|uniref:DUF2281 domain-containing protein n=1 Tax=unclassified Moraxella TaxID=2685852 RepID=UPI0020C8A1B8|nr:MULTISPECIES: DUF2281 domain-containing protein [unclassified Moraxella]UTO04700.1 DUF2281 domain-containing protein [Moraxella sp. FZLJ2107]UTO21428.1 DUF2281 domain-containing protein [Moraxella sp. FZLJ2109]
MITLDLPPSTEQAIIAQAQNAGVSVESYLTAYINQLISTPKQRQLGGAEGSVLFMADDFDAPLDDFKDYM